MIAAVAFDATGLVVIANVAVVDPAATVTDAGTVAAALPEARFTTKPPTGAAALIVTVPVEPTPPMTVVGLTETLTMFLALTVSTAV